VRAEDPREGTKRKTTSSFFTFVALDENGDPTDVPDLVCESEAEEGLKTAAFDAKAEQAEN
jgi:acyl-CoA hydrolase